MTIHQLQIFEVVSRRLNITRAAAELRISQPSVQQQIKSLEESCGLRLYRKVGRGIELTIEGQKLRAEASEILNRIERLERRFEASRSFPATGTLRVGGSHVPSKSVLPSCLAKFTQSRPLVKITLQTKSSRSIERSVINSILEIAIITHPSPSPRLQYLQFGQERVVLFVSTQHRLAKAKELNLVDIAAFPLIIHRGIRKGTGENTLDILKRIEALGSPPTILMECNSGEAVKTGVLRGMGIGILMQAHLGDELHKREVKILKIRDLEEMWVPSFVIFQKDKKLSDNARMFVDMLKQAPRNGITTRQASSVSGAAHRSTANVTT
jgi:DNA-binding transcriptional LysR family regulator